MSQRLYLGLTFCLSISVFWPKSLDVVEGRNFDYDTTSLDYYDAYGADTIDENSFMEMLASIHDYMLIRNFKSNKDLRLIQSFEFSSPTQTNDLL